jgi:hypothetical protein
MTLQAKTFELTQPEIAAIHDEALKVKYDAVLKENE